MEPSPDSPLSPAAATSPSAFQGNDAFFKAVYSDKENAAAFFRRHLPSRLAGAIDWSTLTVLPSSFVQSTLRQTHFDLLFSVRAAQRETLLHLAFEHQTTPDPALRLRLAGYTLEILKRHHAAHGLPLPPTLSYVLHQGPDGWNLSTAFEDLFNLPEELAADLLPWLPKFSHGLLDLSRYDPSEEEHDYRQQAILHLMKLARERRLLEYFHWLAETLKEPLPSRLLTRLLSYALNTDSNLDVEKVYRNLSVNPELEQQVMSIAEKLRIEGRAQGRAEGRMVGRIQALQEFLGSQPASDEALESMTPEELEALLQSLRQEYEVRFKNH